MPSLTSQQKKIIVIVSIAFGLLAALRVASRYCFKNVSAEKNQPDVKPKLDLETKQTKTYPDGSVAEGEFKNEKLHGHGNKPFYDGSAEEEEFLDGELHGQGKKTFSDGKVKEGEFKHGKLDGQGKRTRYEVSTELVFKYHFRKIWNEFRIFC